MLSDFNFAILKVLVLHKLVKIFMVIKALSLLNLVDNFRYDKQ